MKKLLNNGKGESRFLPKGKKGAEMTIGTLVVIILAIIVLVVLALGFGSGWSNLWSKMTGFLSPTNVDSTKQACDYACTTQAKYDFCELKRDINYKDSNGDKMELKGMTCNSLVSNSISNDWGFVKCNEIDCGSTTPAKKCQAKVNACDGLSELDCKSPGCELDATKTCVAKANACDGLSELDCKSPGCEFA